MLAVSVGGNNEWNAYDDDVRTLLSNVPSTSGPAPGIDTTDATTALTYSGNIGGGVGLIKLGPIHPVLSGKQLVWRRNNGQCWRHPPGKYTSSLPGYNVPAP